MSSLANGIAVSDSSESFCGSSFHHTTPLFNIIVAEKIELNVAWEPTLEPKLKIISLAVSSLLSVFPFCACISTMALNVAIGAVTLMAVSGSTTCNMSTVSSGSSTLVSARTDTFFDMKGGPHSCISEFIGKVEWSFFLFGMMHCLLGCN